MMYVGDGYYFFFFSCCFLLKEWASLKDLKALRNELKSILQGSTTAGKNDPNDTRDTSASSNKTTTTTITTDDDAKNRDEATANAEVKVKSDPDNVALLSPVTVPASSS
jgi:hypothetical protein